MIRKAKIAVIAYIVFVLLMVGLWWRFPYLWAVWFGALFVVVVDFVMGKIKK